MPQKEPKNIETVVTGVLTLDPNKVTTLPRYPTDAEPKMGWQTKATGRIDVGGGVVVQGGYSIILTPDGENSVEFYRD